jgi:hypothetical protein
MVGQHKQTLKLRVTMESHVLLMLRLVALASPANESFMNLLTDGIEETL